MMNKITKREKVKKILLTGGTAGMIAGVVVTLIISTTVLNGKERKLSSQNKELKAQVEKLQGQLDDQQTKETTLSDPAELLKGDSDQWSLALVNEKHPLDTSYEPADLTTVDSDKQVDSRMAESLNKMLADAKEAGLSMYVTSAYRSYDRQCEVFNATMQDWMNQGYTPFEAYNETKKSVAVPGTSEHATGLAVDIISTEYSELDDQQGDTDEQKWLMEHCYDYGFILRFPKDKSDITGIIYEPWHYRYVGEDAAKEIQKKGITLEEYVGAE